MLVNLNKIAIFKLNVDILVAMKRHFIHFLLQTYINCLDITLTGTFLGTKSIIQHFEPQKLQKQTPA